MVTALGKHWHVEHFVCIKVTKAFILKFYVFKRKIEFFILSDSEKKNSSAKKKEHFVCIKVTAGFDSEKKN